MALHARHHLTAPDIVRPCLLSKGYDGIPCVTLSDCVSYPKPMMTCHVRHRLTVRAVQGPNGNPRPPSFQPYLYSNGYDGMLRPTLSNCICNPSAKMACHARHHSILCVVQGLLWHATLDVVRPSMMSKGDDDIPCLMLSDHVYGPWAMMEFHARRCSFVCAAQGR